jgi:hypothetical protein
MAIDQDCGQGRANWAEICAGQLDVATRQRGGGQNVVDARREFGGGLGDGWGHGLDPAWFMNES